MKGTNLVVNDQFAKYELKIKEQQSIIEDCRKEISQMKEAFSKRLQDRFQIEDQVLMDAGKIPDKIIDNQEKTELYDKLRKMRVKYKKYQEEMVKKTKEVAQHENGRVEAEKRLTMFKEVSN